MIQIHNKSQSGFSLIEMLLLLMIASLITAGSMSVITKKHTRVPKKVVHGKYTCYRDSSGDLYEERYVEKTRLFKRKVTECKFEPPAKANYFYIQLVGGGGSGGDAGYDGTTRASTINTGTTDATGWCNTNADPLPSYCAQNLMSDPYFIDYSEWKGLVSGDTVYACATSGAGGDGSNAKHVYKTSYGECTCNGTKVADYISSSDCSAYNTATVTCSWLSKTDSQWIGGGSGGASATCSTAVLPVDLGITQDSLLPATGASGSSASNGSGLAGGDGDGASAALYINGSIATSCSVTGGKGGGPASSAPSPACATCTTVTPGTPGTDGTSTSYATCSAGINTPSYTYSHEYETKYMTAGEGGTAGEYLAIFVRSFKSSSVKLEPGRGGLPPALNSGNNGNPGERTSINDDQISVPGGLGGKGKVPLPVEELPAEIPADGSPQKLSAAPTQSNVKTGQSPNVYGAKSSYNRAANIANMDDVPTGSGEIDLNTFGRGGDGGTSEDRCWAGKHIRKFNGVELSSTFKGPISCSDADVSNMAATAGKPGAIVIIW